MQFTAELWESIFPIREAILRHPFILGLSDGSLARASFKFYVVQDALYLHQFARALSMLAARAPVADWTLMFNQHAAGALEVERQLHRGFLLDLGLDPEQAAATPPAPTTVAYTSYLLAAAGQAPFHEGLAAVMPCYRIYWEVGQELSRRGSQEPLYTRWIEAYASPEFGAIVQAALAVVDHAAAAVGQPQREAMRARFICASRYEWMFWDMAYRREQWPV